MRSLAAKRNAARAVCLLGACWALCTSACAPSRPGGATYPAGPYGFAVGATLPDLQFEGVDEDGVPATIALRDYHEPEGRSVVLVAITGGLWCGTCQWIAAHPEDLVDADSMPRVHRLDLVLADRDNAPADVRAAQQWHALEGGGVAVGADPGHSLAPLFADRAAPLPLFVLIDSGAMQVIEGLANPSPAQLRHRVRSALAHLDDVAPPPGIEEEYIDESFLPHEWELLQQTTLPGAPPPDPTNAVADSPQAAALGRALFTDDGLSPSGTISCATCHQDESSLSDGRPRARGMGEGPRRTPSIALASHGRWQFWDGRADSLWAQALGPFENPDEFDSSRVFVARRVLSAYGAAYRAAFPDMPIPDTSRWPASGRPGEPEYDALSDVDRDAITQVFVNTGKALAAWERSFRVEANPLDAYLGGDLSALDSEQKYGLRLFVSHGCMQCHWGPRLTDDAFHVIGMPSVGAADPGRLEGVARWRDSEFRADGPWSDDPTQAHGAYVDDALLGQFKTPALRGVADAAFLGHSGTFSQLSDVTELYGLASLAPPDPSSAGVREPWIGRFDETVQWGLVPFLRLLTARRAP